MRAGASAIRIKDEAVDGVVFGEIAFIVVIDDRFALVQRHASILRSCLAASARIARIAALIVLAARRRMAFLRHHQRRLACCGPAHRNARFGAGALPLWNTI